MSIGVAGVIIVEATKEVMAPVGSGRRVAQPAILKPADTRSSVGVRPFQLDAGDLGGPCSKNTAFSPNRFCIDSDHMIGSRAP